MTCLTPVPECSCVAAKVVVDALDSNRLIQFLMGLNDVYDSIRAQVLLMEPLPSTNKAYSMILRVEKQREVNLTYIGAQDNSALLTRAKQGRGRGNNHAKGKFNQNMGTGKRRASGSDKGGRYCDYCGTHMSEIHAFSLMGILIGINSTRATKKAQMLPNLSRLRIL